MSFTNSVNTENNTRELHKQGIYAENAIQKPLISDDNAHNRKNDV